MEKIKSIFKLLMSIIMAFFSIAPHIKYEKLQDNRESNLYILRDSIKMNVTLYLTNSKKLITDSFTISDIDFRVDSLVKLNDTIWKYMYGHGFDKRNKSIIMARQILIMETDAKIHFPLMCDYRYNSNSALDNPNLYSGTDMFEINICDSMPNISIHSYTKKFFYKYNEASVDSSNEIIYLQYDSRIKVFYTYTKYFNGIYNLMKQEPQNTSDKSKPSTFTTITFNNDKAFIVRVGRKKSYSYIYVKNNWYKFFEGIYGPTLISTGV
jgi:hypothetical protein